MVLKGKRPHFSQQSYLGCSNNSKTSTLAMIHIMQTIFVQKFLSGVAIKGKT